MILKNAIIHEISSLLSGIKITRIEDKGVKIALLHMYLVLRKVSNSVMEDMRAIADKFRDDWNDDLVAVTSLRKQGEPVDEDEYKDFLKAEKDANEEIEKINRGETEVEVEPIDADAFVSAIANDDIDLSVVGYMYDNGLLK